MAQNTHITDPVLPVQEPESASAAKTTSASNGSGGSDGSGASSPSARRHQEQVQNLKGTCEVMDVPLGPDDNLIDKTKVPDKESESASVASMRSVRAAPTPSDSSSRGDGSGAPCPWSLTQEEQVRNLKKNCRHLFLRLPSREKWEHIQHSPWFAQVVAKLRANPCLEISEVEIEAGPLGLKFVCPLHLAVLMGDLQMVRKILETRLELIDNLSYPMITFHYSALDFAITVGESKIVDALLEKNAKVNTNARGSLQMAVLFGEQTENTSKIIQLLVRKGIDINDRDLWGYTTLAVAVLSGKIDIVNELLENWKDKINPNKGRRHPIQIAHENGLKDIEIILMKREDVRRFIEEAYRDRQAYVDAANAILVGAALIASVTFASWLQPPLNYTASYHGSSIEYVDVEHNLALGCFWVFNTLSFYFAIGTVVCGAHSVLPRRRLFITENVKKLSENLFLTSIFLAFSVLFVIVAFGIAGFIVLIPILRYRWYMIAPTILGGLSCIGSIGYLFKSLWVNRPWISIRRKKNSSELDVVKFIYC